MDLFVVVVGIFTHMYVSHKPLGNYSKYVYVFMKRRHIRDTCMIKSIGSDLLKRWCMYRVFHCKQKHAMAILVVHTIVWEESWCLCQTNFVQCLKRRFLFQLFIYFGLFGEYSMWHAQSVSLNCGLNPKNECFGRYYLLYIVYFPVSELLYLRSPICL